MKNCFTYESNDTDSQLETFEWDNVWLDHADDAKPIEFSISVIQFPVESGDLQQ